MSFNEKTPQSEHLNDDEFDYLDSLMQDVMGAGELESPHERQVNQHHFDDENTMSHEEIEPIEEDRVPQEQSEVRKNKRVPLFQQFGFNKERAPEQAQEDLEEDSHIDEEVEAHAEEPVEEETVETGEEFYNNEEGNYLIEKEPHEIVNPVEENGTDEGLFDNLLDDLSNLLEEEIVEPNVKKELFGDLDDSIEVPLHKKEMEEIKVTPDGRTLAEMIPSLRKPTKSSSVVVENINAHLEKVEVGDKKFADNRYTKHAEQAKEKKAQQEERKALSNKFLQRNAKFTEQEKIIMENLGITNEQYVSLLKSKKLSKKEKEEIIGLGKHGMEKHFKGRRYRTTIGDVAMLEFLAKFKFANTRILRWISHEPQARTWRKLNRLKENGLAESKSIIGVPDLWGATPAGLALSGYDLTPGLRPMPKMITISSTMGANYLAACLWFNSINVLNLDDFPAHNRVISTQEDGRNRVRGEMLVSELEIRSSLGREITPSSSTMQTLGDERLYDVISANVREEFENWERSGRLGESPEFGLGNEYMWVLYPTSRMTLSYHVPDLVVKRDRGPNGEPRSIAIELERHIKDADRYDKIMLAYKLDKSIYEKVIWVTQRNDVARALANSAERVGFENYSIVPIITETGTYTKQDIWMI